MIKKLSWRAEILSSAKKSKIQPDSNKDFRFPRIKISFQAVERCIKLNWIGSRYLHIKKINLVIKF